MNSRRSDWIAVGFLVALITIVFADVVFFGYGFFQRDLTVYHFPMKRIVRDALLEGTIPLWNPYLSAGQPLAANPAYEVFYPPQLLVLLPDFVTGYSLHILFHLYLGAIGMYFLLRSLGLRVASSVAGAVAFALGGPLLSLVRLLPFLFALSWVPLIFLFGRRALKERRPADVAAASLCGGMQALVAEPTTFAQTVMLLAAYAVYRWWSDGRSGTTLLRVTLLSGVIVAGSLLVGAAQLVPAADFARDTVRSKPFDYSLVSFWSMPWKRPVEMLLPRCFRDLRGDDGAPKFNSMYSFGDPFIADFYIGLLPAIAALALLLRPSRRTWFAAGFIALSYLIATGNNGPILRTLFELGIFDSIRYPEKFALSGLFVLTVCAAIAIDRLFDRDRTMLRRVTIIAGLLLLFALVAAGVSSGVRPPDPVGMIDMNVIGPRSISARAYWLWIGARALALGAVAWALSRWNNAVWPQLAAIAFLLADLAHLRNQLAPAQPGEFFDAPALARNVNASPAYRLFHAADWEWADNTPRADQFMGDGTLNPWMIRNGLFPRTPAAWGIAIALEEDFDQTHLLATAALMQSIKDVRSRGQHSWADLFMPMANIAYRADFTAYDSAAAARPEKAKHEMQPTVVSPVGPYPRYYLADQVVSISSREEFVDKLVRESWSARVAFVNGDAFAPAGGTVSVVRESAESALLDVEVGGRAFLCISISPHRYWRATVNGAERPLVVSNIGFQGLVLESGKHRVELRYENRWIVPSLAISLIAIAAAAVVIIVGRRPRADL